MCFFLPSCFCDQREPDFSLHLADRGTMVRIVGSLPFWSSALRRDWRDQELLEQCAAVLWVQRPNLAWIHVVRLPVLARRHLSGMLGIGDNDSASYPSAHELYRRIAVHHRTAYWAQPGCLGRRAEEELCMAGPSCAPRTSRCQASGSTFHTRVGHVRGKDGQDG
jgi:hypothetical protein